MPDSVDSATLVAPAASPVPAAPAAAPTAQPAPQPTVAAKVYSEDHVKELIAERDRYKAAAKSSAPPPSEFDALRAELDFKERLLEEAPHLTREQRAMVLDQFKFKKPGSDELGDFIKRTTSVFGRTPVAQPATAQAAVAAPATTPVRTDMGSPGAANAVLPDDPRLIPKEIWDGMDPVQRRQITERWKRGQNPGSALLRRNPPMSRPKPTP